MDNKKFEQLIELILNENEEQARALFHDIVVEKSREIYESMMDDDMDEGMGGQVGDMLDEISAEQEGMTEEEEDEEFDMIDDEEDEGEEDFGDDEMDMDDEEMDMDDEESDELEDRVMDLEDKLDQLMADFEAKMGSMDDEEESLSETHPDASALRQERSQTANAMANMNEETLEEAVQLQKVSVTHGDNGVQTKSPNLTNSGQAGMDSKPVKFSGQAETVPTSPKAPSNAYSKGETQVKGAGSFKNAPGHKGQDLDKAPAAVKSQASGVNNTSPVAESKKTMKKIVK